MSSIFFSSSPTLNSLGGTVRPARRAHNSAVLVVPNVKVMMEAKRPIPPLNLHHLLQKALPFLLLNIRHKIFIYVFALILCTNESVYNKNPNFEMSL
jgi:hypothetical protein